MGALLAAMEHTLKKISNQARFIKLIVDGKLKISKRKRMDIVKDLKERKFDIWLPSKDSANTLRDRAKATDAFENEDEENEKKEDENAMDVDEGEDDLKKYSNGYKYLLSMSLASLTMEKVAELLKKEGDTLQEVNALRQKTVKDLWRDDLEELDKYLDEYEKSYEENVKLQRKDAEKKRKKTMQSKIMTKKTTKRKVTKGKTAKKEQSVTTGMKKLFSKTKVTKNTNSKKKEKIIINKQSNTI